MHAEERLRALFPSATMGRTLRLALDSDRREAGEILLYLQDDGAIEVRRTVTGPRRLVPSVPLAVAFALSLLPER